MNRYMSSNAAFSNNAKSKPVTNLKWRRVVFKISGAALVGDCQNIDPKVRVFSIVLLNLHQFDYLNNESFVLTTFLVILIDDYINCFLVFLGSNADC